MRPPRPNPPPGIVGHNRTMVTPHYAVMPPEGVLESRLPGWDATLVRLHTSPSMGAGFAQALLEVEAGGGTTAPVTNGLEHFLYVLSGTLHVASNTSSRTLPLGGLVYSPAGAALSVRATDEATFPRLGASRSVPSLLLRWSVGSGGELVWRGLAPYRSLARLQVRAGSTPVSLASYMW